MPSLKASYDRENTMITVTVELKVKPGKEAEYEAIAREATAVVNAEEPGNVFFGAHRGAEPGAYMIIAQFKDEAAKKAHEDGDHLAAQRAKFGDVLAGPPVRNVYRQI